MKAYKNILNILTITLFLCLVSSPFINERFNFIPEEKGSENRTKAPAPIFDSSNVEKYVKEYDTYYTDNFSLRNNFITYLNQFEYKFFGVSAVPSEVIIGKEGWFYEMKSATNYKGLNVFSKDELTRFKNELINRTKWAEERKIKYYLAIVPNKMNVYPEYLPQQIIKISEESRYDQIVSLINERGINVIDIRKNLLEHKNADNYLYQHTDDHWNELGAYYGYQAIMNRLNKDYPELSPIPVSDYTLTTESKTGDLTRMINAEKDYPEQFISLTEKNKVYGHDGQKRGYKVPSRISEWDYEIIKINEHGKKLKCLIIRDSFTLLMIKFLQEHFKECVFIHDEWKYRMREDLIMKEKPDIILNIVLETEIHKLIEFPFVAPTHLSEKSVELIAFNGKYVCAENNMRLYANKNNAGLWETFTLFEFKKNECALLSYKKFFLSADQSKNNEIIADREEINNWEKYVQIELRDGFVAFKSSSGKYITVDEKTEQLFATADSIGTKEKFKIIFN